MNHNIALSTFSSEAVSERVKELPTPKQPIRVLIADDHPRSRNGLRALLSTSPTVKVVGEAADGREAVRLVEVYQPDVVVMDAQMPVMDGLEASRRIKRQWPQARIIMLTVYNTHRAEAAAIGIDVFLSKGCSVETLLSAILTNK
jgi:DNA-binding NarL/FixJ family response regulator